MSMKRKGISSLMAGAICAGLAGGLLTTNSQAAVLVFDTVATGTNDPLGTVSADGKTVSLQTAGSNVTFNIFATITNGNTNQGDDGLIVAVGSIISGTGGLKGNITAANVAPFANNAFSQPGTPTDVGGDGDLDIGADPAWKTPNDPASDVFFHAGTADATPAFGTAGASGNLRQLIGTATFTLASGANGNTTVQFIPHTNGSGNTTAGRIQQWQSDGVFESANGDGSGRITGVGNTTGLIDLGQAVSVSLGAVPEPGSLALAGLGGLGLLLRRRRHA